VARGTIKGVADPAPTALAAALERVGDRWTLLIVEALLDGPRRFGDLLESVDGIAPNILTQRLRHLEREAVLVSRPYSERPPRMAYELSAAGAELAGALRLLSDWGARHTDSAEPLRHSLCGTALEARWWCPSCDLPVDEAEADDTQLV
jgi:DNA-binding HxlR family transcriptional regulator